jgi:hypothetical protein
VPLWVDSCTISTAQTSPSGRSDCFRPGKKGAIWVERVLVVEVLDLGREGGRVGDDVVFQVDRQVDKLALLMGFSFPVAFQCTMGSPATGAAEDTGWCVPHQAAQVDGAQVGARRR